MFKKLVLILSICLSFTSFIVSPNLASAKSETVDEWLQNDQHDEKENVPIVDSEDLQGERDTSLSFPFFKMLVALAFIVFLIYALAKFVNKRTRAFSGSRSLQTLGGISVGQNRSIQIVKVGERLLVVGVSDQIQLLKEINDEHEIQQILQEHESHLDEDDLLSKSKEWLFNRSSSKNESFSSVLDSQFKKITQDRKKVYSDVKKQKESRDE